MTAGPVFTNSNEAQRRLHELVPGGSHTYARGSDQYPEFMSPIIERGAGAHVWDIDGNHFVEYGQGLRAVTLGYGYAPVAQAVAEAAASGTGFARPSIVELRAAETFLAAVPGADMVKFGKNGSDATTAAVKLARAATGRDMVAVCSTQPFFSSDDWFMCTTPMGAGIPEITRSLTVGFAYNDLGSLREVLDANPGRVAAVILEAATATAEPAPGFLQGLRSLADTDGFVLVFDEMITGMRWARGGAQSAYGVIPDLSTWGKALANGFSIAALAGKRELMELGGLATDAPRVSLMSTTHGGETTSLAAMLAVAGVYDERDIVGEMESAGESLRAGWSTLADRHGLAAHVPLLGRSTCLVFATRDHDGAPSQYYRALFIQELLRRGVLAPSMVVSAAHGEDEIELTLRAVDGAMGVYARALEARTTDGLLHGRPIAPAIRTYAAPRRIEAGR